MFTAKDVMALRERTGAGMMDCKKAMTACEGDMEKAVDFLREKGLAASKKKEGRIAAEGLIGGYLCPECGVGALVEVNCETDFVAKTNDFKAFVNAIAQQIAKKNPATVEDLMTEPYFEDESMTVDAKLNAVVAKVGEKIKIRRFVRSEGIVDIYIHLTGKIGTLIVAEGDVDKTVLHDIAMHIAACKPAYIMTCEVPESEIEKEKEIAKAAAINEGKTPEVAEKMVMGRGAKYLKVVCLMEQPFVKDAKVTIKQLIGGKFSIKSFTCYTMGEGLQKREDNFAEEVMSQVK